MNHASMNDYRKVERMVKQCLRLLRHKDYELNITTKDIQDATKNLTVVSEPRGKSCASANAIIINSGSWWRKYGTHVEYKNFENDPVIGTIRGVAPDHALMALVAHEVAHYVQFRFAPRAPNAIRRFADWRKPHGNTFKHIYRHLRRDLVNPMIADVQKVA